MGISRLNSFVQSKARGAFDVYTLRDTRLVIDGWSLKPLLEFSAGRNGRPGDLRCGGQYRAFHGRVCDFFGQLRANGVEPIVIVDGLPEGEVKWRSAMNRAKQAIARCNCQSTAELQSGSSFTYPPTPWSGAVMAEALLDVGVPCLTADGEADTLIAVLARKWACPVLTNDCDFFMFDLPDGVILLSDLNMTSPCSLVRRFVRSRFLELPMWRSFTNGVSEGLLALAAGLAGNDFVTENELRFLRPLYDKYHGPHPLVQALFWLVTVANCATLDEGFVAVEKRLQGLETARVMSQLRCAVDFFDVTSDKRQEEAAQLVDVESLSVSAIYPRQPELCCLREFPPWLIKTFRLGCFSCIALSAAQDHLSSRRTGYYIEDIRCDPIAEADQKLRSVMYGIVLAAGKQSQQAKPLHVVELARCSGGTMVQNKYVNAARSIHGTETSILPSIGDIEGILERDRANVLLSALDSRSDLVAALPVGWQFPVATIRHWIRTSQRVGNTPSIHRRHIITLLVGMAMSCPHQAGPAYDTQPYVQNLENLKRFLSDSNHPPTGRRWEVSPPPVHGKLDIRVIHVFNQWQRIVRTAEQLNSVLAFPLPTPKFHLMFDGEWAYRTYVDGSSDDGAVRLLTNFALFDALYNAATDGLDESFALPKFQASASGTIGLAPVDPHAAEMSAMTSVSGEQDLIDSGKVARKVEVPAVVASGHSERVATLHAHCQKPVCVHQAATASACAMSEANAPGPGHPELGQDAFPEGKMQAVTVKAVTARVPRKQVVTRTRTVEDSPGSKQDGAHTVARVRRKPLQKQEPDEKDAAHEDDLKADTLADEELPQSERAADMCAASSSKPKLKLDGPSERESFSKKEKLGISQRQRTKASDGVDGHTHASGAAAKQTVKRGQGKSRSWQDGVGAAKNLGTSALAGPRLKPSDHHSVQVREAVACAAGGDEGKRSTKKSTKMRESHQERPEHSDAVAERKLGGQSEFRGLQPNDRDSYLEEKVGEQMFRSPESEPRSVESLSKEGLERLDHHDNDNTVREEKVLSHAASGRGKQAARRARKKMGLHQASSDESVTVRMEERGRLEHHHSLAARAREVPKVAGTELGRAKDAVQVGKVSKLAPHVASRQHEQTEMRLHTSDEAPEKEMRIQFGGLKIDDKDAAQGGKARCMPAPSTGGRHVRGKPRSLPLDDVRATERLSKSTFEHCEASDDQEGTHSAEVHATHFTEEPAVKHRRKIRSQLQDRSQKDAGRASDEAETEMRQERRMHGCDTKEAAGEGETRSPGASGSAGGYRRAARRRQKKRSSQQAEVCTTKPLGLDDQQWHHSGNGEKMSSEELQASPAGSGAKLSRQTTGRGKGMPKLQQDFASARAPTKFSMAEDSRSSDDEDIARVTGASTGPGKVCAAFETERQEMARGSPPAVSLGPGESRRSRRRRARRQRKENR